jgi:hypothetical protein
MAILNRGVNEPITEKTSYTRAVKTDGSCSRS